MRRQARRAAGNADDNRREDGERRNSGLFQTQHILCRDHRPLGNTSKVAICLVGHIDQLNQRVLKPSLCFTLASPAERLIIHLRQGDIIVQTVKFVKCELLGGQVVKWFDGMAASTPWQI